MLDFVLLFEFGYICVYCVRFLHTREGRALYALDLALSRRLGTGLGALQMGAARNATTHNTDTEYYTGNKKRNTGSFLAVRETT